MNIDFNDLKYNLYELLNVKPDVEMKKIKKRYRNLIIRN